MGSYCDEQSFTCESVARLENDKLIDKLIKLSQPNFQDFHFVREKDGIKDFDGLFAYLIKK